MHYWLAYTSYYTINIKDVSKNQRLKYELNIWAIFQGCFFPVKCPARSQVKGSGCLLYWRLAVLKT